MTDTLIAPGESDKDNDSEPASRNCGETPAAPRKRRGVLGPMLRYGWCGPTTLVGLCAGGLTLCSGGRAQIRSGALEFHGGFSRWMGNRFGFAAMTLGHVIIGRDPWSLDYCREHEQAHVRQAERWGPAFLPAYLAASVAAACQGKHYYFDNVFEVDARRACGEEIHPHKKKSDSSG